MIEKLKTLFKRKETTIWDLPVANKEKIDDKIADFIISQADKALAYSLDVADKTTNRAYAVILIMTPITSTAISLLVKEITEKQQIRNPYKIGLYEFLTILCVSALILLLTIVLPRLTMGSGREPKNIAHDHMLQNENSFKRNLLLIKLNEIKNLQYKISYNDELNDKRVFRFKLSLLIICIGFLGGAIIYAMLE